MHRWVVRLVRLQTSSHQASSSSCTSAVSWTCIPVTIFRACLTRVNMPLDPATAGVMLHSSPRSLIHLRSEVECAFLGMATSAAAKLYYLLWGRRSRWVRLCLCPNRGLYFGWTRPHLLAPAYFRRWGLYGWCPTPRWGGKPGRSGVRGDRSFGFSPWGLHGQLK